MITLTITSEPQAKPEDLAAVRHAVDQYNMAVTKHINYQPVAIFLRDESGGLQGGVLGDLWGGWLHLTFLWVSPSLRRQGYGARLLQAAEDQALEQSCRGIFLETFSFQAKPFYERYGYKVVGSLKDYPATHTYYFMQKLL